MSELAARQLADLADMSGGAIQLLGSTADETISTYSIIDQLEGGTRPPIGQHDGNAPWPLRIEA